MGGFYIDATMNYYEGDQASPLDTPYPQRPDARHVLDGAGGWKLDNNADIIQKIADIEANAPPPFNAIKRSERQSAIIAAVAYAVAVEGITEEQLYATNNYYKAGKDLEDSVVALRKKLQ